MQKFALIVGIAITVTYLSFPRNVEAKKVIGCKKGLNKTSCLSVEGAKRKFVCSKKKLTGRNLGKVCKRPKKISKSRRKAKKKTAKSAVKSNPKRFKKMKAKEKVKNNELAIAEMGGTQYEAGDKELESNPKEELLD